MLYILYVKAVPASTRAALLAAARELIVSGGGRTPSAGAVAARAGVSRLTVYHHFGSHAGMLRALADETGRQDQPDALDVPARARLHRHIAAACERWASDPKLFRGLPAAADDRDPHRHRDLAVALAERDQLRPGCSVREAEDVIAVLTSFAAFDRLHQDGRRSTASVVEVLMRMAGAILAAPPS
jgi:AcrR family transcriptional regulator